MRGFNSTNRYIRNADITPNKNDIRSTAYMNELSEISREEINENS
jgi:hypothetical protein